MKSLTLAVSVFLLTACTTTHLVQEVPSVASSTPPVAATKSTTKKQKPVRPAPTPNSYPRPGKQCGPLGCSY